MSTATAHPALLTAVDAFNIQLAHAKLSALKLLQDLMASLTDPDAAAGSALRELRLAAAAILRTAPLKHGESPPKPPPSQDPVPHTPPQDPSTRDPGPPPPPTFRANLNPTCRAARNDIRTFLREGHPDVVPLFLTRADSRAPPPCLPAPTPPDDFSRNSPSSRQL